MKIILPEPTRPPRKTNFRLKSKLDLENQDPGIILKLDSVPRKVSRGVSSPGQAPAQLFFRSVNTGYDTVLGAGIRADETSKVTF